MTFQNEPKTKTVSIYTQGNFTDLCRGPHVPNTGFLKYFKLTKVSGSYWKGDSKGEKLQRIYGTCFLIIGTSFLGCLATLWLKERDSKKDIK